MDLVVARLLAVETIRAEELDAIVAEAAADSERPAAG
jgi:hypothetical protein